jgi:hypothetical protein
MDGPFAWKVIRTWKVRFTRAENDQVTDCQMSVMEWLAASRRGKTNKTTYSFIHIVAVTASAIDRDEDRCRDAGMDTYFEESPGPGDYDDPPQPRAHSSLFWLSRTPQRDPALDNGIAGPSLKRNRGFRMLHG